MPGILRSTAHLFCSIDAGVGPWSIRPVPPRLYSVPAQLPEDGFDQRRLGAPLWAGGITGIAAVLLLRSLACVVPANGFGVLAIGSSFSGVRHGSMAPPIDVRMSETRNCSGTKSLGRKHK